MNKTAYVSVILFFLLCPLSLKAQSIVDSPSAEAMVQALMSNQAITWNETLECDPRGTGIYTGDLGIGLDPAGGITLGSGKTDSIIGTPVLGINDFGNGSFVANTVTDTDYNNLLLSQNYGGQIQWLKTCKLSFDMVPLADSVSFSFVYASERAKHFPCSNNLFNDVVGIFISGGNYPQPVNIAFVPGTDIAVSSNSISSAAPDTNLFINVCGNYCNGCSYTQYFVDNYTGNSQLRYRGYTLPLNAGTALDPCDTYHVKIGIGFNSVWLTLFLAPAVYANPLPQAGLSLSAQSAPGMPDTPHAQVCRGCSGSFTIVRESSAAAQNISYTLSGSAINGTDYAPLSGSVSFEPGQDTAIVTVEALNVDPPQPPQTLVLSVYSNPPCGTPGYLRDTMLIIDRNYTGIEGSEEIFPFQIAPNPFHNSISVFAPPHENWQAELYDITGRSCLSGSGNTERLNASLGNLESLQAGIYILKVSRMSDGRKAVFKLIKE